MTAAAARREARRVGEAQRARRSAGETVAALGVALAGLRDGGAATRPPHGSDPAWEAVGRLERFLALGADDLRRLVDGGGPSLTAAPPRRRGQGR